MGKSSRASESVFVVIVSITMLTTCRAVAARETAASKPTVGTTNAPPPQPTPAETKIAAPTTAKKDLKKSLKGVVVKKKKPKPAASSPQTNGGLKTSSDVQSHSKGTETETAPHTDALSDDAGRESKRRKLSHSKG